MTDTFKCPPPAGATESGAWDDSVETGQWWRLVAHAYATSSQAIVEAQVWQNGDGCIDLVSEPPHVRLCAGELMLTPEQARDLAATLLDAADQADGWAQGAALVDPRQLIGDRP